MKTRSIFSPIIRSQGDNLVSATKVIIEKHVTARSHKIYSERKIKRIQ